MGLQGSVKAFSLDDLLNFLTASGHDGTLHVFHKEEQKTLYLWQSGLYFERSTWSFRLGDVLIRRGEITAEQLQEALEAQRDRPDFRVGDVLVDLGFTSHERIMDARRHQVEEEIYELFSWPEAFFEFKKGVLPDDFEQRRQNPEEFRFEVRSVLMEAVRRIDELGIIRATLPSERRLYVLANEGEALEKARHAFKEAEAHTTEPQEVFDGRTPLGEMSFSLGLSSFETQSLVAGLISEGAVRPFRRHELESRFRLALEDDLPYALKLYECALESSQFDARGRFMDRVLFGNKNFREATQETGLRFAARLRGKRAFEVMLSLFRQGVTCRLVAKEESRQLTLLLSKSSLVLRVPSGSEPPNVMNFLLARSPVPDADMSRVRELQRETGQSLRQILVGGGYVTIEDWFRAQKDAVLNEMFNVFLLRRPFLDVELGKLASEGPSGLDLEVPLLPWLHAEVMTDVRNWETILTSIPSIRTFLRLTQKGEKELKGPEDPFRHFDGQRSLEEVLQLQSKPPQDFLNLAFERLQNGRLEPLPPESYRERFDAAMAGGKRASAIDTCVAAIDSGAEIDWFSEQLNMLQAGESEISVQDSRPTLRGDLANYSLAEVLQSFHLSKRSGSLKVAVPENPQLQQWLYLEQGQAYLLTGDVEELEGDLEEELLASGHVTEEQLASAAAQQMKDEVYEMFLWEGAEFEFAADHLPPEFYSSSSHRKIRLNTVQFLMGAIRRQAEWEEVREILPNDQVVLQFVSSEAKMQALRETGSEDLLLLVDGRHPVADLVRISAVRRFKALALLANLVRQNTLEEVDLTAVQEEDEDAILATDLPTSGVIEEGFVGQLQFVGTLQDMSSAELTGILRLTDGRRSKELALIEGGLFRTSAFHPDDGLDAEARVTAVSEDTAQDLSECFSWSGTRFELLAGTIHPRLDDPETRKELWLDPDQFFDAFAEAAERWGAVAELIPRDKCLDYVSDDARERARRKAGEHARLVELVDGNNSAEDVARLFGHRFQAMCWLVELFEDELVEVVDPPSAEGDTEEDWDFSL